MKRLLGGLSFAPLVFASCFNPSIVDCSLSCSNSSSCPDKLMCNSDNFCVNDATTLCTIQLQMDAAVVDASLLLDAQVLPQCTEGNSQAINPLNDHCYMVFRDGVNWNTAQASCQALGNSAHLLTLASQVESDFVQSLVADNNVDVWLGLRGANNQYLTYENGESALYSNWSNNQPDRNDEECVEIWNALFEWNDVECSDNNWYVCERP